MKFLKDHKRIVVKIGSALLVNRETGKLRRDWLNALCDDMAALRKAGAEIIIVSSGAIALGRFQLGLPKGPLKLEESQAAAAAGQILLAPAWAEGLARGDLTAGQLLLTLNDTEERRRYLNARATVETLLKLGAVPVINENDTVATSEIRYGDNDRLGARVATMAGADCLVLLSDIDGLYTKPPQDNPDAEHIPLVPEITPEIAAMAGKSGTEIASGGMHTKIEAGKIATTGGTSMVIASGKELHPLQAIDEGARCTWFLTGTNPVTARKKWISGHVETIGSITIDQGASKALGNGRSLLPAGVKSADGNFRRGDPVLILNEAGQELARGLIDYDFDDAIKIIGRKSHEFEVLLGYAGRSAMVHRDNMVLSNNSSTKNSRTTEEEND